MKQIKTYILFMPLPDNKLTLFKIGKSKDIKSRLRQHKSSNPLITSVYIFDDNVEKYLHWCFEDHRMFEDKKREWFYSNLNQQKILDLITDAYKYLLQSDECCEYWSSKEYKQILKTRINE